MVAAGATRPAKLEEEEEDSYLHFHPATGRMHGTSQRGPGERAGAQTVPLHPLQRTQPAALGTACVLSPSSLLLDFCCCRCCRNHYRERCVSSSLAPADFPVASSRLGEASRLGMLYLSPANSTGAASRAASLISYTKDCSSSHFLS